VLFTVLVVSLIPSVLAQVSIGSPAEQISVEISISVDGDVHVEHLIKKSKSITQVDLIPGTTLNLEMRDVSGKDIQPVFSDVMQITIFPTDENVIIEYDLEDVLRLDDGIWTWNFYYTTSSSFLFPEEIDLIYTNERPLIIEGIDGIKCHATCQLTLKYIVDEPIISNEVEWEAEKFSVLIRTIDEIDSFNFDHPSRSISFNVNQGSKPITMIIPLELLWNPYEVYFEDEKILKHEFSENGTHVWLNVTPKTSGNLKIVGTSAIPEFPIMISLVLGIAIIVTLQQKNKFILR